MKEVLERLSLFVPEERMGANIRFQEAEQFRHRLQQQLKLCKHPRIQEWSDRLVDIYLNGTLADRRTEGIRILSRMIMSVYSRLDDDGNLVSLELRYPSELSDADFARYSTWCPSTMFAEAHPDIEILLVGQAPAYAENKVGVPLVDYFNLVGSACVQCSNFDRCFVDSVLVEKSNARFDIRVLGCSFAPADEKQLELRRIRLPGMNCNTAGELLRQLLLRAMIRRPSWGDHSRWSGWVVGAATNAHRRTTFKRSPTGVSNGVPDPKQIEIDSGWLWLEAALIEPKATVLLGNDALLAYQHCTGNKRKPSINPFDHNKPFGVVYKTFHPSYVMRSVSRPWKVPELLDRSVEESFHRHTLVVGERNHHLAVLVHMLDVLTSARKLASQSESLLERVGECSDILPSYVLGVDAGEDVQFER